MKKMDSDTKRIIAKYLALLIVTLIAAVWWVYGYYSSGGIMIS